MPTILLIRHAQASFGAEDYDVLSELGEEQAALLVRGLAQRGITPSRVVCGDLRRQRDTAAPIAAAAGLTASIDARWNEYVDRDILAHHATVPAGLERREGDAALDSRQFQEILNGALAAWIDQGPDGPADETHPAFLERLRDALDALAGGLGPGETAIAVSSGGAIAALSAGLLDLPRHALIAFNHVSINAAITKLTVGRSGVRLISTNEHGHLEAAGRSRVTYR